MCPNHWSNVSGLLHSMGCKDMCVILAHASAYFLDFYSKRGNQLEALKVQGLEGDPQFIVTSCAFPFRNVMLCVQYNINTINLHPQDFKTQQMYRHWYPMPVSVLLNPLVVVDVRRKKLAMSLGA